MFIERAGVLTRQIATHAPQQTGSLFDHLVSAVEKRWRNCDAEGVSGLEIDQELELCRLLDRNFRGLGAL